MEKGKKNRNRIQKQTQKVKSDSKTESTAKAAPSVSRLTESSRDVTTESMNKTDTVIDPAIQFAGLKRETEDILKISESGSSKFKKREVFSNWEKYEIPEEESESIGADFGDLLNAPISVGGHFKFKSEKTWDIDFNVRFREYFNLDLKILGEGLSSLSFYERQNIDKVIFSKDDISKMANRAERSKIKYNLAMENKTSSSDSKYIVPDNKEILSILSESIPNSEGSVQAAVFHELTDLQEHNVDANSILNNTEASINPTDNDNANEMNSPNLKPGYGIDSENIRKISGSNQEAVGQESLRNEKTVTHKNVHIQQEINVEKIIEDEDLDDLLNLKAPVEEKLDIQPCNNHEDHLLRDEPTFLPSTPLTANTKLDLEDWLDDLLN